MSSMRTRRDVDLRRLFGVILQVSLATPFATGGCSRAPHSRAGDRIGDATLPEAGTDASAGVSGSDAARCAPELVKVNIGLVDGQAECRAIQLWPCGMPESVRAEDAGCAFDLQDCLTLCPSYGAYQCAATGASCPSGALSTAGPVTISCDFCPGNLGRRPRGLGARRSAPRASTVLGAYFADAYQLEALSVQAFLELASALASFEAPRSLVRRARSAAGDERRHARIAARLSRRFGGRVEGLEPTVEALPPTLEELAIDNAVEGCVRETYAALVATFQARRARDPEIARALVRIAADETRHAALAWDIARWAQGRLDAAARARVEGAARVAREALFAEISDAPDALSQAAGVPRKREQAFLLDEMTNRLWAA
jgi:hypothetical protein